MLLKVCCKGSCFRGCYGGWFAWKQGELRQSDWCCDFSYSGCQRISKSPMVKSRILWTLEENLLVPKHQIMPDYSCPTVVHTSDRLHIDIFPTMHMVHTPPFSSRLCDKPELTEEVKTLFYELARKFPQKVSTKNSPFALLSFVFVSETPRQWYMLSHRLLVFCDLPWGRLLR